MVFSFVLGHIIGQEVTVGFLVNAEQDFTGLVLERKDADYLVLFINPLVELCQILDQPPCWSVNGIMPMRTKKEIHDHIGGASSQLGLNNIKLFGVSIFSMRREPLSIA